MLALTWVKAGTHKYEPLHVIPLISPPRFVREHRSGKHAGETDMISPFTTDRRSYAHPRHNKAPRAIAIARHPATIGEIGALLGLMVLVPWLSAAAIVLVLRLF